MERMFWEVIDLFPVVYSQLFVPGDLFPGLAVGQGQFLANLSGMDPGFPTGIDPGFPTEMDPGFPPRVSNL